ncbi:DUF3013 family protein [Pisciglobus halotolerans]|uniref:Uncharacterized protein n=1 Tax=Pisciglobus halotolerans TaxID=745365 RepID=A0A1I3BZH4_9LACT|nr:DUF3013 family protein [Pisciglobus halotolerans]SFH67707.1 Protein of unknown function [Pisciglobus halotolerans]
MTKETIITYLENILEEQLFGFEWHVNWQQRQHLIEVAVVLYAEAHGELVTSDVDGTVNEPHLIQFEDSICFYDPHKSKILPDDYLKTIPFDSKAGIEKGLLDAVIKVLRITAQEGQSNLIEFVKDPAIETFELVWNETNLENTINTLKSIDRYNKQRVPYPKY